ncbi:protein phosphatase 1 regulatory subunit 12A-like isoform X1 [Penaeus chinensis]|uniref:protein phosphatase 1 regulatory subunit 12A-like isoform X1 n=1 Tax=Penaeus chinensis TaxID=139456 RepID=UPI001FB73AE9|nr:protein phosphatase 1 regulatory subunit 12A-like isoform X1 [Penaeus chinensis]
MAVDNRSASALFKRAEQLRRWQESETNKTEIIDNNRPRKVNFSDGCIFLAACAAGDKQEVLRLLEKGADIDTANVDGLTALHAACIDDNLDMVEFLVDQGADVNRGDMEGWTALHATASCGFNSIAKFLIDRGADLSLVNNDGDLAIDIADSDEMESLLQREIETRGIDCDASRNEEERRMLEDAQMWLGAGYLADRPHPKTGATALHVASAKGYIKVMSLLLEAGSDINAQDLDGWTPLHAAAHWGQREAVEILAENMADMDVRNFVGQSAFDVADNSLLRLMDELKRKQVSMKVTQNKQTPRKRKTSPHREHSNKKEREDQRESDGTSGDESSSDVEKKNKVNKENATPQIIPTSVLSEKNSSRALPQARADSTMDESEVQSWRRPSSLRKTISDDKNQKEEVSRNISTQPRLSTRESEDILTGKRAPEKDESSLSVTRERLKARSCPALSQLEEEEGREGGGGGGGAQVFPRPRSRLGVITSSSTLSSPSSLAMSQRLSSSDMNLPTVPNNPSSSKPHISITNTQLPNPAFEAFVPNLSPVSSPVKTADITITPPPPISDIPTVKNTNINKNVNTISSTETCNLSTSVADTPVSVTPHPVISSSTSPTTTVTNNTTSTLSPTPTSSPTHRPLGQSLSTPVLPGSSPLLPSAPSALTPSSSMVTTSTSTTTITTAGLASLSTNQTTNNKDPRLLARSASLRERIQRNHVDSMARVTLPQEPNVSTSSVVTTNASPPARTIGSNVTTLTTNGGLNAIPPPPKNAPTLVIPPKQPNQNQLPSPTSPTSPPLSSPTSSASSAITSPSASTSSSPAPPPPSTASVASQQPLTNAQQQSPSASKMSPSSVIKNFFKSFVPPSRDEESETQRKAHAKMVRSTRRSTQGVTLEDIKSAEQLMKNKQQQQLQQQAPTSSPESKESPSSTLTVSTPTTQGTPTTTPSSPSSKPKPESPTKPEEEERRPSWRLKVDETDKNKFSLENVRSKDKPEVENDAESVTVPLRKKNSEEKADEDKDSERVSQTREGTQAAIQRRKKPKRRSTGRVQVNMDEIDPEKRAQRLAEQQQQPGDEGSEEEEEEKDSVSVGLCRPDEVTCRCTFPLVSDDLADGVPGTEVTLRSVSERGEASKGSTTSLGSTINSRPSSRAPSLGPENGDIDYKKLYEEQLEENFRVHERLRDTESELRQTREAIDLNNKKNNTRLAMAEADKREKRALERKLSEMEEELKQLQKLKAENEKLKAENRALTRVVSKLTNSATSGMGNLATLSK